MTEADWTLLSDWVDGRLGPAERQALEARLSVEPELAQAAQTLTSLERVARSLRPDAGDVAQWQAVPATPVSSWPWLGGVGALVVAAVLAGWALLSPSVQHDTARDPSSEVAHVTGKPVPGAPMPLTRDAGVLIPLATVLLASSAMADSGVAEPPARGAMQAQTQTMQKGEVLQLRDVGVVRAEPAGVLEVVPLLAGITVVRAVAPGTATLRVEGQPPVVVTVEVKPTPEALISLSPTRRKTLETPGRVRWSVGDSNVVAVEAGSGDQLVVVASKAGSTTLEAWFADGSTRKWPIVVAEPGASKGTVRMGVGSQKVLDVDATRFVVADPAVVEVKRLGKSRQHLLIGLHEGKTTLVFENVAGVKSSYEVQVFAPAPPPPPAKPGDAPRTLDPSLTTLRLGVGETADFALGDIERFSVADSLLSLSTGNGGFRLRAETPVRTTLLVWRKGQPRQAILVIVGGAEKPSTVGP